MNLADVVRRSAHERPEKTALVFRNRDATFADLDHRVDMTAAALAALGVRKGDRVALLAGNVPEFASSLFGILRAGAIACPLNVMLTPEEIAHILDDAGAKVVITELASLPGLADIREDLRALETVIVIGGPPAPPNTVSLEEALATEAEPPNVRTDAGDVAVIAYTAGTTAEPKGAMLTHRNLLSNLEQMSRVPELAMRADDVVLLALPVFHIYALNAILGLAIRTGATSVLVERFDPEQTLELVERHRVTVLFGAPPMFSAWTRVARARATKPDLASVRLAVSGAAALPPEVMREFGATFGVTIWEGYGLTEAAPAVTSNAAGPRAKPGSIGVPLPGVDVRIVDERGNDCEEEDEGEILVRGPNVFAGYWNRPEDNDRIFSGEWLRTGDVAIRDEDGYLYIVDRKKDLVIVSGFNVYPKEVEQAIEGHPKVAEAAVVGVRDDRTGEAVQAWVVPRDGASLTPQELEEFLSARLARFKRPRDVRIVDELPHHVTGKVLRRALREPPAEQ